MASATPIEHIVLLVLENRAFGHMLGFLPRRGALASLDGLSGDEHFGEHLLATIYNALRADQEVWETCLFVLIYDEHGGFYDHVVPPAGVPNPDGLVSPAAGMNAEKPPAFDCTRLGMRVPAILVSPWIPPSLDKTVYEHASVSATLKRLWRLPSYLTRRDAAAGTCTRTRPSATPVASPGS